MCLVTQSCPTLRDPLDCSLPDFSVHGIFQVRILEWVAISSPEDFPKPGINPTSPTSPALAGRFFPTVPTQEGIELSQTESLSSRLKLADPPILLHIDFNASPRSVSGPKAFYRWWGCHCSLSRAIQLVNIIHFLFFFNLVLLFWPSPQHVGSLVPQPGTKSRPPAKEAGSLHHWITREVSPPTF